MKRRLWYKRIGETEERRVRAEWSPGEGWHELARDLQTGETVRVVDGRAEIVVCVESEGDRQKQRRAAIAAALPDILLAVADGADLRDELERVLQEAKHGNG